MHVVNTSGSNDYGFHPHVPHNLHSHSTTILNQQAFTNPDNSNSLTHHSQNFSQLLNDGGKNSGRSHETSNFQALNYQGASGHGYGDLNDTTKINQYELMNENNTNNAEEEEDRVTVPSSRRANAVMRTQEEGLDRKVEFERRVRTKESCQTHRQADSNKENNNNSQGYFTSLNDFESV